MANGMNPDMPGSAGREWGQGSAGGYGRSGDYGHAGGRGQFMGADAGQRPQSSPNAAIVQEHWMRGEPRPSPFMTLLAGIGIGAALMYFLDPDRGTRRRNIAADRALSAARSLGDAMRDRAVDTRNRAGGAVAELRGRLREDEVTDEVLVQRVRAELGHQVERMRPIEVVAEQGAVTLRGEAPADDVAKIVATVQAVRGVQRVENQLQVS